MKCPPVLLIIFNRADLALRVFETIRQAQPGQLFIAADGPRADRAGEMELCQQTRDAVADVDWKCEVHHLYREENLGCGRGPTSAIDWFFEHVETGIILEDDILPEATFYPFCGELLEKYKNDERIFHIGGCNPMEEGLWTGPDDYKFWYSGGTWGWASWRRAWKHFDPKMTEWPEFKAAGKLEKFSSSPAEARFCTDIYSGIFAGGEGIWDWHWMFTRVRHGALSITPRVNLIRNIGFDPRATHTRDGQHFLSQMKVGPLAFPLTHPASVEPDYAFGKAFFESMKFDEPAKPKGRRNFFQRMARSIRKRTALLKR